MSIYIYISTHIHIGAVGLAPDVPLPGRPHLRDLGPNNDNNNHIHHHHHHNNHDNTNNDNNNNNNDNNSNSYHSNTIENTNNTNNTNDTNNNDSNSHNTSYTNNNNTNNNRPHLPPGDRARGRPGDPVGAHGGAHYIILKCVILYDMISYYVNSNSNDSNSNSNSNNKSNYSTHSDGNDRSSWPRAAR